MILVLVDYAHKNVCFDRYIGLYILSLFRVIWSHSKI